MKYGAHEACEGERAGNRILCGLGHAQQQKGDGLCRVPRLGVGLNAGDVLVFLWKLRSDVPALSKVRISSYRGDEEQ
jgi:hypothetical protein